MIRSALFGLATGDALGVPIEFKSREEIRKNPLTDMIGYGTYHQPPGTWSDDASLTFCLAEVLADGFDLSQLAASFQKWLYQDYWTPHGEVFDVGIATREAIGRLRDGVKPELAGGAEEHENGNGSLMRILPLIFHTQHLPVQERFQLTKDVSSITHRHIRSIIACFYYLEFAKGLLAKEDKFSVYKKLQQDIPEVFHSLSIPPEEVTVFHRLLTSDIADEPETEIRSSGYVLDTLEASIWCLLTTDNFKDAVLKAVNLGEDTDTTGAVTGGLAGILYGFDHIPKEWIELLARKDDIDDLARRLKIHQAI